MFPKDTHVPIRHIESCNEKPSDEIISTFSAFQAESLVGIQLAILWRLKLHYKIFRN